MSAPIDTGRISPEKTDRTVSRLAMAAFLSFGAIWSIAFGFYAERRHSWEQAYRVATGHLIGHVVRASVASLWQSQAKVELSGSAAKAISLALLSPRLHGVSTGALGGVEEILWITFANGQTVRLPVEFNGRRLYLLSYRRRSVTRLHFRYANCHSYVPLGPLNSRDIATIRRTAYHYRYYKKLAENKP